MDIKEDGEEKTQPDEVENRNSDETGENKLGIFIVKFRDEFSKVLKKVRIYMQKYFQFNKIFYLSQWSKKLLSMFL